MTDDRQLITECIQGRNTAFEELIDRYQDRLYNAVRRIVDNPEDATDVVQDTLLNAFAAMQTFRGESHWYTWLHRIAMNAAINLKRKRLFEISLGIHEAKYRLLDPPDDSRSNYPSHQLEKAEEEQLVHQALMGLAEEHRLVLVLKDMEGLSYEKIAERLQLPVGTVGSRLHRARVKFRQWLEEKEGDFGGMNS